MVVVIPVLVILTLSACASKEWSKAGVSPGTKNQDQASCNAVATAKGREKYPKLIVYSTMTTGGTFGVQSQAATAHDINQNNFNRARVEFSYECMLEKGYRLE
jgi:hypothetical protein